MKKYFTPLKRIIYSGLLIFGIFVWQEGFVRNFATDYAYSVAGDRPHISEEEIKKRILEHPDAKPYKEVPKYNGYFGNLLIESYKMDNILIGGQNRELVLSDFYAEWDEKFYTAKDYYIENSKKISIFFTIVFSLIFLHSFFLFCTRSVLPFLRRIFFRNITHKVGAKASLISYLVVFRNDFKTRALQKDLEKARKLMQDDLISKDEFDQIHSSIKAKVQKIRGAE